MDDAEHWAKRFLPRPQARMRVFCFPYAGAGAAAFLRWMRLFPEHVEVRPIEYPGRWTRESEPLCDSIPDLADGVTHALRGLVELPYVLMGYSFGALVAFEVVRRLMREGLPLPQTLVPCAQRAPHLPLPGQPLHELPDSDMVAAMERVYGAPAPVPPELMVRALPLLRTDLRARERYLYEATSPVAVPLRVCGGTQDAGVGREHLEAWRQHTSKAFSMHLFEGGHFFINENGEALRDLLLLPAGR